MSLINDALKRAKESEKQNLSGNAPPLLPVEPKKSRGGAEWMLILAAILFIGAICLFVSLLVFKSKNVTPPVVRTIEPVAVQPGQTQQVIVETKSAPAAPAETPEQLPKVQGIFFDATHPAAIINRTTVHIGDRVGDYQIKTISRNSVTFQRADGSLEEIRIGE